ncbi:MAG: glycosyltransferase, partial [Balneola sp.]
MKIVDVAEFYTDHGGGVKTYINQKLQAGAELGHEIVIIAPGKESREEERFGGKVIWVQSPPLLFDSHYYKFSDEKEIHEILNRENPDLVEASSPWKGGRIVAGWKGNAVKTLIFH